mgnify:FL=1
MEQSKRQEGAIKCDFIADCNVLIAPLKQNKTSRLRPRAANPPNLGFCWRGQIRSELKTKTA